jgi:hypothetical protein
MSNLAHTARLLDCQRPTLVVNMTIYLINITLHNLTSHRQVHQALTHIDDIQPHTK